MVHPSKYRGRRAAAQAAENDPRRTGRALHVFDGRQRVVLPNASLDVSVGLQYRKARLLRFRLPYPVALTDATGVEPQDRHAQRGELVRKLDVEPVRATTIDRTLIEQNHRMRRGGPRRMQRADERESLTRKRDRRAGIEDGSQRIDAH